MIHDKEFDKNKIKSCFAQAHNQAGIPTYWFILARGLHVLVTSTIFDTTSIDL